MTECLPPNAEHPQGFPAIRTVDGVARFVNLCVACGAQLPYPRTVPPASTAAPTAALQTSRLESNRKAQNDQPNS